MLLTPRLKKIADLIPQGSTLADIGTDHAYLPVYLVENGKIQKAIAADLRVGPLENARDAVVSYGFTEQIELRLSDGLDNFKDNEVEEISEENKESQEEKTPLKICDNILYNLIKIREDKI